AGPINPNVTREALNARFSNSAAPYLTPDRLRRCNRERALASRFLERDDFSSSRHPALPLCLSMIFSENR
ncbi:MAG: hypothetical protein ACJ8A4_14530, partial [Microvirga sp.]